jgi:hypothetical protein
MIFDRMVKLKDPRALPTFLEHTEQRYRNEARGRDEGAQGIRP